MFDGGLLDNLYTGRRDGLRRCCEDCFSLPHYYLAPGGGGGGAKIICLSHVEWILVYGLLRARSIINLGATASNLLGSLRSYIQNPLYRLTMSMYQSHRIW